MDIGFLENEQWITKVTNVINYYARKMSIEEFKKIP